MTKDNNNNSESDEYYRKNIPYEIRKNNAKNAQELPLTVNKELAGAKTAKGGEKGSKRKRCVRKVMLEEEMVPEYIQRCHLSQKMQCHSSYVTGEGISDN